MKITYDHYEVLRIIEAHARETQAHALDSQAMGLSVEVRTAAGASIQEGIQATVEIKKIIYSGDY